MAIAIHLRHSATSAPSAGAIARAERRRQHHDERELRRAIRAFAHGR